MATKVKSPKLKVVKKKIQPSKVSVVLDEKHLELTEENVSSPEVPERKELAGELFKEPSSVPQSGTMAGEPEPFVPTLPVQKVADDQSKVDQIVNESAVVDKTENVETGESESASAKVSADKEGQAVTLEESNSLRWILILIILFLVGLMGGLFYFFILQNKTWEKPKSNLKTVAVYTPSPTLANVAKNTYKIRVLNGSGVTGQAGSVQTLLTTDGYNVPDIGNADNSNYTKTEIQAKSTVDKTFLANLEKDLSAKYSVNTTVSPPSDSETDDVVVIIGSQ